MLSMNLCSIQNKCSSPFLSIGHALSMFLDFGHFSASRSFKKVFTKNTVIPNTTNTATNLKTRLTGFVLTFLHV